jgi:hypothetical protein
MGVGTSPLKDRVLFVEGSPRSGTSWLNSLLAMHPEIAGSATELHLFEKGVGRLFDNLEEFEQAEHTGIAPVVSRAELVDLVRDLCDQVLLRLREQTKPDAPFVMEKTPAVPPPLATMARKAECYPDAWHVHILRDGQAVAASLMNAPWIENPTPEACVRQWRNAVDAIRAAFADGSRYREITYDDLRADPARVCGEVFAWLGLRHDEEILKQIRLSSAEPVAVFGEGGAIPYSTYLKALARHHVARLLRRSATSRPAQAGTLPAAFATALRGRDAGALRDLTTDDFAFEARTGDGDLRSSGDAARAELLELAEGAFGRMRITEHWATSTGTAFHTVYMGARTTDAKRIDLVLMLFARGKRIRQAVLVSAGSVAGRPLATLASEV